jgi:sec-independent protein translocase protein TatA
MTFPVIVGFGMPAAPEWIVIAVVALILLGPKKLPDLAKGIGRALGEIQKAREDFQREITGVPLLPKISTPPGMTSLSQAAKADQETSDIVETKSQECVQSQSLRVNTPDKSAE